MIAHVHTLNSIPATQGGRQTDRQTDRTRKASGVVSGSVHAQHAPGPGAQFPALNKLTENKENESFILTRQRKQQTNLAAVFSAWTGPQG